MTYRVTLSELAPLPVALNFARLARSLNADAVEVGDEELMQWINETIELGFDHRWLRAEVINGCED